FRQEGRCRGGQRRGDLRRVLTPPRRSSRLPENHSSTTAELRLKQNGSRHRHRRSGSLDQIDSNLYFSCTWDHFKRHSHFVHFISFAPITVLTCCETFHPNLRAQISPQTL